MANTYSQLCFHIVFSVKFRKNLIKSGWEDELYMYITGVVSKNDQKMLCLNGMPDHIHLLIGTKPSCCISDLVRIVKSSSSKWINERNLCVGKFKWQTGFGAFTVSQSQLDRVARYIVNQKYHHRKKSFGDEYKDFMNANEIDYSDKYLFD